MAERLANDAASTLAAGIDADDTALTVASAATFPDTGNFRVRIGDELLLVTGVAGETLTVTRGVEDTTAAVHTSGAAVTHVLTAGALSQFTVESGGNATPTIVQGGNLGATESITVADDEETWLIGTLNANLTLTATMGTGSRLRLFGAQDATGGRTLTITDGSTPEAVDIPSDAGDFIQVDVYSDGTDLWINANGGGSGGGGGGGGAVDSVNGQTGTVTLDADDVGAQPVDSDLTAIAALATTAFGRGLLVLADAAAGRTAFGLGTAATAATGDFQPADSDLTAIAALTTTAYGRSLLEAANAGAARTLLGLGTAATSNTGDFQAAGAAAGGVLSGTYPNPGFAADMATQAELDAGLAGKQDTDADLTAIAGLSPSNDDIVQRKSGAWTNRTPAQVKTDLALVKGDVGLGNVDNTSDANKPVSTAVQTALDAKVDESAVKLCRVNTGAIGASSTTDVTVTFSSAFADTNYTVVATVEENTVAGANGALVRKIISKATTNCVVRVSTVTAISSGQATLHVIAIHD